MLQHDTDHWLSGLPSFQRKTVGPAEQNYLFFFPPPKLYGWQNFLSLRNASQNTEQIEFTWSWRLTVDIRAEKRSHGSKFRLTPKYANACMFIFSVLSHYDFTFAMPIHGFFSFILRLSSFWLLGSRDSCWPTLGRDSKRLRNAGLQGQITVHVLSFVVLDTKGIRMSVAFSSRSRCVTTKNNCCNKPAWFVDHAESHDTVIQRKWKLN